MYAKTVHTVSWAKKHNNGVSSGAKYIVTSFAFAKAAPEHFAR